MSRFTFCFKRAVAAAPTITHDDQLKSPQSLRGGQKFVIDAAVGGVPTPTTGWTHNGQPLTPSAQMTVDATPTSSKLTITDANTSHSGTYVLKAENVVGAASAEFTLAVKGIRRDTLTYSGFCFNCSIHLLRYGDSAGNTVEENSASNPNALIGRRQQSHATKSSSS